MLASWALSVSLLLVLSGVVVADQESVGKVIESEVLGDHIFSLYDKYGYRKIEVDNEYADLQSGEQYWLVVDSRHEYLTLRTQDDIVVEIIIRNPDLTTKRGVKVGDKLSQFVSLYPEATKLTHYRSGVVRRDSDFYVESEQMEVHFGKDGTANTIRYR